MTTTTKRQNRIARLVGLAISVAAVAIAFVALGGGSDGPAASNGTGSAGAARTELGPPVPDLPFEFFDGTTATLAHYEGRPLVVNFWASWCPSCVAELSGAFVPVQDRLGDEVSFVGFAVEDRRSEALALVAETGVLFDLADDPDGRLHGAFGGLGLPVTVLVSPDGEILHRHNGAVTEVQLQELIDRFLLEA